MYLIIIYYKNCVINTLKPLEKWDSRPESMRVAFNNCPNMLPFLFKKGNTLLFIVLPCLRQVLRLFYFFFFMDCFLKIKVFLQSHKCFIYDPFMTTNWLIIITFIAFMVECCIRLIVYYESNFFSSFIRFKRYAYSFLVHLTEKNNCSLQRVILQCFYIFVFVN